MKKNIITGSIILASISAASAQGLYDIAPDYTAKESLPIKWTAGLSFGFDDNISPASGVEDDVTYVHAFVGASLVHITPQTTWSTYATVGGRAYFDAPSNQGDDFVPQVKFDFNINHEVSERLRLTSSNYVAYESEPDYENGFGGSNIGSDYLHYNSKNSVGYRWTERLATYTGFGLRGIVYEDFNRNNRQTYSLFNNFRYSLSQQDTLTFGYRYAWTDANGRAGNVNSHLITAGLERRLNENSIFKLRAGVQVRDVDGGESTTGPYIEGAIRTQVNERFSLRAFARYSTEEYGTSFLNGTYDENNTFRIGVNANYRVSQPLTLLGGVNYINTSFEEGRTVPDRTTLAAGRLADADQDLYNIFVGFSYELNDGVFFNGTYNWTTSDSDIPNRDYDRNRASLGVRVTF